MALRTHDETAEGRLNFLVTKKFIRYGKTSSSLSQKDNKEKDFQRRTEKGKTQEMYQGRAKKGIRKPLPEGY